jgi:hypothetical protein
MDTTRLMQEIDKRNTEQGQYATIAAQDIDQGQNPFMNQQPQPMQ